jgi:hypothetical protein
MHDEDIGQFEIVMDEPAIVNCLDQRKNLLYEAFARVL